jgi:hypothetical protein
MNELRRLPLATGIGYTTASSVLSKLKEFDKYDVKGLIRYKSTRGDDPQLGYARPLQYRELMYLLRDVCDCSVVFDISEYDGDCDRFTRHMQTLAKAAKSHHVFIWISGDFCTLRETYAWAKEALHIYSKVGIVVPSNSSNVKRITDSAAKHRLSIMLWHEDEDCEKIMQMVCYIRRKRRIPRVAVVYTNDAPSNKMLEEFENGNASLKLYVSPRKVRKAIRIVNKHGFCGVLFNFGEKYNPSTSQFFDKMCSSKLFDKMYS